MKFLWIFSVYLLCLAVLPCHDGVECPEIKTEKTTGHQKHASDNEQCPPFCSCACCGMQMVNLAIPVVIQSAQISIAETKMAVEYQPVFPSDQAKSIWQPPKLS
ncbi:DUF6660 family protein [Flavobacterium silvaticum]|uniref:DUF2946 domain-containing protein n=1 Tax=Flavobacterium silvaticum TaxID=1852020 RepID=A0A972FMT6_9FLAO|nr:DUF6660 family protein [Flavobacterium silvaticum]NMH28120.1 hypothetical protein [Flavobacterium silvaticum]